MLCGLPQTRTVLLTGAARSLPSHLIIQERVLGHIVYVNRGNDASRRYHNSQNSNNLDIDAKKVSSVPPIFSKPRLGMVEIRYGSMIQRVDHAIHNS